MFERACIVRSHVAPRLVDCDVRHWGRIGPVPSPHALVRLDRGQRGEVVNARADR